MVVKTQVADGFSVLHERVDKKVGVSTLHCADFRKTLVYETVCVATHRGLGLIFIFTGSGQEQVETMIGSTGFEPTKE